MYSSVSADAASAAFEIPGTAPAVIEFRGNQILYATHGVDNLPVVLVAVSAEGRERLAWPNSGISDLFPTESSRLTLDGKGVYGFLPLDAAARAFFGLASDIPTGAGVAATYRFAGEKLLARGSEAFAGVVALAPDDMLLTLRRGGLMRVRAGGGVAWKREAKGGDWAIADVDLKGGTAVALDTEGAAIATGIENGEPRWLAAVSGARIADARLLPDGRLLVLAPGAEHPLAILDPASGRPAGAQPAETCGRAGLAQVYFDWVGKARTLAGLIEPAAPPGSGWLIRGAEG